MRFSIFCAMFFLYLSSSVANEWQPLEIGTYNSPPYQYLESEQIKGDSVYTLQCIFHKLKKKVKFSFYPLQRAWHELKNNRIDAMFPVEFNNTSKLNYSAPISIEKWYWITNFSLNSNTIIANDKRIGAVNGSPAYFWLKNHSIPIDTVVTTKDQLLQMFKLGRLDAIIIDDNDTNRDISFYKTIEFTKPYWRFIKFEPHHLVFSDNTLVHNPSLLNEFNNQISSCQPASLKANLKEQQLLQAYLKNSLTQLLTFLETRSSFPKLKEHFIDAEVQKIDAQWIKEVKHLKGALYDFEIHSELGIFLARLQKKSNGGISEILLIDSDGYAIALSQPSTDLYQGDENKFLNTFPKGNNAVFVSDITYDESTQRFQSQVSYTLSNENAPIGVVTFGVNIEKILLGSQSPEAILSED